MRMQWLVVVWILIAMAGRVAALEIHFFEHPRTSWYEHGSAEPAWSPDGKYLAYTAELGPDPTRIVGAVLRAADLNGELLPWIDVQTEMTVAMPTWSPDGSRLAFAYSPSTALAGIWVVKSGEPPSLLSNYFRWWMDLAWSPKGDAIAVTSRDTLWLVSPVDGSRRALRTDGVMDSAPAWSPDGHFLAFCSERSGNPDLWVLDLGTSALQQLTTSPADDCEPTWSPNGAWVAFSSNRGGRYDLWVVPAAGGDAIRLMDDAALDGSPAWSPGGDQIAFVSTRPAPDPLFWGANTWIASHLPDFVTSVAPKSWSDFKRAYR